MSHRVNLVGEPALLVLLWSSGAVAIGIGLEGMSPQLFLTIRAVGAAVCASTVVVVTRASLPTGRDLRVVIGAGLLLQVAYQGAYFSAIAHGLGAGMISLIMATQPLLTVVATGALTRRSALGAVVGAAGVGIAVGADASAGGASTTAFALAAAALIAITAGTIVQSSISHTSAWACVAIQSSVSAVAYGAAVGVLGPGEIRLTTASVCAIAWVTVVISVIATALLYRITRQRGAVTVSGLFLLVPSGAALLDVLLSGTAPPPLAVLGGAVAVSGLALLRRSSVARVRPCPGRRRASPS